MGSGGSRSGKFSGAHLGNTHSCFDSATTPSSFSSHLLLFAMKRILKPDNGTASNPYPCKYPRHESPSHSAPHTHLDEQWVSATVDMSAVVSDNMVMQSSDLAGPTIQDVKSWNETTLLEWVQKRLDVPLSDLAGPTIQDVKSWDETTLLEWVQKRLDVPLKNDHIQKFLNDEINGSVFLSAAGQKEFFQEVGITLGPSMQLAQLAQMIVDGKDVQKFLNAEINGSAFLSAASQEEFFQRAGIPLGPSKQLAQLAQMTVDGESKFSFLTYLCLPLFLPRLFTTASLFAAIHFLATH